MTFQRGLSPQLEQALIGGTLRPVLTACRAHDLDLRIRKDGFNVYEGGCSVLRVTRGPRVGIRLEVHRKYLGGVPPGWSAASTYAGRRADAPGVADWIARLAGIRQAARRLAGREGPWEGRLIRSLVGSSVVVLDRQVQLPGRRPRADVVAIADDATGPRFLIIEVKCYPDPSIQRVPGQLDEYRQCLALGGRLKPDVADSYQLVSAQLQRLGLPAPAPTDIQPGMPVDVAAVVFDYKPLSKLIPRARTASSALGYPVRALIVNGGGGPTAPMSWPGLGGLPAWPWPVL
jgi:hypothetical protein